MRFFRGKKKEVEVPLVKPPSVADTPQGPVQKSQEQSEGLKTAEEDDDAIRSSSVDTWTQLAPPPSPKGVEGELSAAAVKKRPSVGFEEIEEEELSEESGPLEEEEKVGRTESIQPASGPQTAAEIKEKQGLLVTIISARNLRNADADKDDVFTPERHKNVSDPFAICELNRLSHTRMVTQVIQNTLNPVWSCEKQFQYYTKGDPLYFAVYDYDTVLQRELLGTCILNFSTYYPKGYEGDLVMESQKHTGADSSMRVKVQVLGQPRSQTPMADWFRSESKKESKAFAKPLHHREEFIDGRGIAVTILCASNLPNRDAISGRSAGRSGDMSDPWVQVEIPSRPDSSFKTPVVRDDLDPVWNYTGQLYSYKIGDSIKFVIWDKDEGHLALKGDMLGKVEVPWEDWKGGLEARLQLPDSSNTSCGKYASFLSLKIEILGPPLEPPQKAKPKEELKVSMKVRETKHMFLEFLRHRRGTTFRGWRLDVDKRCNNRVSYTDLMASCRCLGLSLGEARRIWSAFRPPRSGCPATPIEYHEFDPEEWLNLNAFLEVLWEELNFDLDLTWSVLDPKGKGFITYEEFAEGMDRTSFDGDAQLVFSGLDTGGQGRLWRHEIEVLKLLPPESHASTQSSPLIMEFKEWANATYSHPQALVKDLGMTDKSGPIPAKLLATKLQKLGFKGDTRHLSMALTKMQPGIGAADLMEMITGKPERARQSVSYAGRKWGFAPPAKLKKTSDTMVEKPLWSASVFDPAPMNSRLGRRERHYFFNAFDRPIRDEVMQKLKTKGYNFMQAGELGEAIDRHPTDRKSRQAVGGPKSILGTDLEKVREAIEEHSPGHPDVLHSVAEEAMKNHQKAVARGQAAADAWALANPTRSPRPSVSRPNSPRPPGSNPSSPSSPRTPTSALLVPTAERARPGEQLLEVARPEAEEAKEKALREELAARQQARAVDLSDKIRVYPPNGEFKIRVYLLGGVGLSDKDVESSTLICACELVGKPNGAFEFSIDRETVKGNYKNVGEMTGVVVKDLLEFTISEPEDGETEEDEEEILGIASLAADKFLPNGFEGRLKIMNEDEEHMEGTFILVKVDVLS